MTERICFRKNLILGILYIFSGYLNCFAALSKDPGIDFKGLYNIPHKPDVAKQELVEFGYGVINCKLTDSYFLVYQKLGDVERIKLQIDPLGFLQFGPSVSLEMSISANIFLTPHFRYYYAGLLYHGMQNDFWQSSDVQVIAGSMGIGINIKSLLGNITRLNRYYVGGYMEYGFGGKNVRDAGTYGDKLVREAEIIAGGIFGYKWRKSRNRSLNLNGVVGVAFPTKNGYYWENELGQPWHSPQKPGIRFYYLAELKLGFSLFTQIGKRK
jgi:hypothetical protein